MNPYGIYSNLEFCITVLSVKVLILTKLKIRHFFTIKKY